MTHHPAASLIADIDALAAQYLAALTAARADAERLAAALETPISVWEQAERIKPLGKSSLGNPPIWVCDARAALTAHQAAAALEPIPEGHGHTTGTATIAARALLTTMQKGATK